MSLEQFKPRRLWVKIALLIFLVAIALVIRLLILPIDGRVVYSTFYPAIGLVALLCGYRFGLAATAIAAIVAYWYLLLPSQSIKPLEPEQLIGLLTFLGSGFIICLSFTHFFNKTDSITLKPKSWLGKLVFMIIMILIAFLLRISFLPVGSRVIYSTFYPAIAVVALSCGFRMGIFSILTAAFIAYFSILPPYNSLKVIDSEQAIGLLTFFVASGIICVSLREVILRGQMIKKVNDELQDLMATNTVGKSLEDLVSVIASTVDMRDPYTAGHQRRVSELALEIGKKMNLPEGKLMGIKLAGLIHDLGKLSVPLEILTKPGQLSEMEMELIKEHPKVAYKALKTMSSPWPLADIVAQHHERIDGSGYPAKLSGEDILIEARILAVADVVEAMTTMRPYREGLGINAALSEIRQLSGIKYDPAVVDACIALFESGEFSWSKEKAH